MNTPINLIIILIVLLPFTFNKIALAINLHLLNQRVKILNDDIFLTNSSRKRIAYTHNKIKRNLIEGGDNFFKMYLFKICNEVILFIGALLLIITVLAITSIIIYIIFAAPILVLNIL